MEYIPIRVSDIVRQINRDLFLPAIQREFVWSTSRVERLFDSIMADFPIGSFLYWRLQQEKKDEWPVYEFIRNFDKGNPHNPTANMAGIMKDVILVLDGQQRIASLYVGLKGTYRYFYYRWRETRLFLNLLRHPVPLDENPEELTYGFAFRESDEPTGYEPEYWYPVGRILDFEDAEDAKVDMKSHFADLTEAQRENANKLIGRLHNKIHTTLVANYYEEKSQDYDKVLQIFVRANSAGQQLEYSDLLLATATAKWEGDARSEIYTLTDSINEIGTGYKFGKDFVLKACLYLSNSLSDGRSVYLPIQYKVKNFTRKNLRIIERNWDSIKESLTTTVRLISRFGFNSKDVVAPLALLPIALYIRNRGDWAFDTSSRIEDAEAQVAIRKWFVFSTLKNAFGGSSDTTLTRLRDIIISLNQTANFPSGELYASLGIEPQLNQAEIEQFLSFVFGGRYTNLVLSLLYPDRYWRDKVFHQDHIFPKSQFQVRSLRNLGYDNDRVQSYVAKCNQISNLQLITETENLAKSASPFEKWINTQDDSVRKRHLMPEMESYGFDSFESFFEARKCLITNALRKLQT